MYACVPASVDSVTLGARRWRQAGQCVRVRGVCAWLVSWSVWREVGREQTRSAEPSTRGCRMEAGDGGK